MKVHYIHLVVGASNLGTYYIELLHCTSLASLDVRAVRIEEFPFLVLFWVPLFLCTLQLTSGELSILWKAKLFAQKRIWQWMTSLHSSSRPKTVLSSIYKPTMTIIVIKLYKYMNLFSFKKAPL